MATYDADDGISSPNASVPFSISSNGSASWSGTQSCNDPNSGCNLDFDFGLRYNGIYSISGYVFYDDGGTGDGLNDIYEPGSDTPYENVTVYLWDDSGSLIGTTTTDASGQYNFTNLINGDYTVSVNTNSPQLSGLTLSASPSGSTSDAVTIDNANVPDEDFGFYGDTDYGDLPDSYNTYVGNEGAGHTFGDHYLGIARDSETNGQPDSTAEGDDLDADGNDDDGVRFLGSQWFVPGGEVGIEVEVVGDNGYLVGFFDWGNDGAFGGDGELIVFGDVINGSNTFVFNQPATMSDTLNIRFRLYDKDEMIYFASTGLATNGEVEDYQRSPESPTSVTLVGFSVQAGLSEALVTWETSQEVDSLGYNIYRTSEPNLPNNAEPLNNTLIPSQIGNLGNHQYQFNDPDIEAGVTYYFWLEYVGLDRNMLFGPMDLTLSQIYLPMVSH